MKRFLRHRSRRWGYDGWALQVKGATTPLWWTVCTTREEARELCKEPPFCDRDLFQKLDVVKVKISVGSLNMETQQGASQ